MLELTGALPEGLGFQFWKYLYQNISSADPWGIILMVFAPKYFIKCRTSDFYLWYQV